MKKITARDVARKAGVSVGTVSRILNNLSGHAPATIARVRAAMYELGFSPPKLKPSGMKRKVHQVALLFPDHESTPLGMVTPLGLGLAKGADEVLARNRQQLLVTQMRGVNELPYCITRHQVEGVLVRDGVMPDSFVENLRGLPCVRIFGTRRASQSEDVVTSDNYQLGLMAARTMLGARKKKFLLITHDHLFLDEFQLRVFACRLALQQAGVEVDVVSVDQIKKLAKESFTAFIPGHDEHVEAVARLLGETGGWSKGKFSLVAAVTDRDRLTRNFPWMEVVSVYSEDLGRAAAQQLLWRMQHPNDSPRTILVPPRIITNS